MRCGLALAVFLALLPSNASAQQGKGDEPQVAKEKALAKLPPLVRSVVEHLQRMENRAKETGEGNSTVAIAESRDGKSRSYKRTERGGKVAEEGDQDLAERAKELLKSLNDLKKEAPITIEISVGERSCKAVVQDGKLISTEGNTELLQQYELDATGMVRDAKTGELAPSANLRVSSASSKASTKSPDETPKADKKPRTKREDGET